MNPIIGVGTRFDISGHIAKVTAIQADGVECELGGRKITVAFSQVETALDQAAEQLAEEKPKKKPAKKSVEEKLKKRSYQKKVAPDNKGKGKSNVRSRSRKSDKSD